MIKYNLTGDFIIIDKETGFIERYDAEKFWVQYEDEDIYLNVKDHVEKLKTIAIEQHGREGDN